MAVGDSPLERVQNALKADMIAAGLARSAATPGEQPPVIVEPAGGPPIPGVPGAPDTRTVLALRYTGEQPPGTAELALRRLFIDLVILTKDDRPFQRASAVDHRFRVRYCTMPGETRVLAAGLPEELEAIAFVPWTALAPIEHTRETGVRLRAGYAIEVAAD